MVARRPLPQSPRSASLRARSTYKLLIERRVGLVGAMRQAKHRPSGAGRRLRAGCASCPVSERTGSIGVARTGTSFLRRTEPADRDRPGPVALVFWHACPSDRALRRTGPVAVQTQPDQSPLSVRPRRAIPLAVIAISHYLTPGQCAIRQRQDWLCRCAVTPFAVSGDCVALRYIRAGT